MAPMTYSHRLIVDREGLSDDGLRIGIGLKAKKDAEFSVMSVGAFLALGAARDATEATSGAA